MAQQDSPQVEYTKGEWRVDPRVKTLVSVDKETGINGLADCSPGQTYQSSIPMGEREANANLIALSPRMAEWIDKVAIKQDGWLNQADLDEAKEILKEINNV